MIGIYNDEFIDYLRENLGCEPKITSNNIITRCPVCWDRHRKEGKDHKHLYISLEAPIFNCFQSGCYTKGLVGKLIKYIEGKDTSEKFVNKQEIKKYEKLKVSETRTKKEKIKLQFPDLKQNVFRNKEFYLKKRLKFQNINLHNIYGLVFDIREFLDSNNIVGDMKLNKMKDFLHNNFIGFVTRNNSSIIFRNIDHTSKFRYYKYKLVNTNFMDYYCINNINRNDKNTIVLSEGIFDIFCEYLFDSTNNKNDTRLYASSNSDKFQSIIKSIIFDEQMFRPDVKILSDQGINLDFYKRIKHFNKHIINTLTVYYNKAGKDFGDLQIPTKFVL